MTTVDHLAIHVLDVATAIRELPGSFKVLWQDPDWAFIEYANVRIALVRNSVRSPAKHPQHIAVDISEIPLDSVPAFVHSHRDGSESSYPPVSSFGLAVEILHKQPTKIRKLVTTMPKFVQFAGVNGLPSKLDVSRVLGIHALTPREGQTCATRIILADGSGGTVNFTVLESESEVETKIAKA